MIIWGGEIYNGSYMTFGDGARFNQALNTWTSTATNGAPSSRSFAPSVWTGSEMIIWGGFDGTNSLSGGSRYSPLSNSWTAVSTSGAPSPRYGHSAIWTGSEMIIWGGLSGTNNFNDGMRYNPLGNTWTAIATNSTLAGRYVHSAVWTGSKMVVWGGNSYDGSSHPLGDGGIYDPVLDTWTSTATNGAPAARYDHTTVWTGTEMIVWGGFNVPGNTWFGDGGRYNPVSNSWTATTGLNAPSARYAHVAVWTGTEMIVWGGYGGGYFNTGGRYNPSSDSWQTTTTTGAPAGRYAPSAVWTGAEMIVTGGQDSVSYFNDVFSYTPPTTLYLYLKP